MKSAGRTEIVLLKMGKQKAGNPEDFPLDGAVGGRLVLRLERWKQGQCETA